MIKHVFHAAGVAALLLSGGAAQAADPEDGKKVFRKCRACHKVEDGQNGVGPHLFGVVGRPVASVEGYKYSRGMAGFAEGGKAWTIEELDGYLANPRKHVKGTKMAFGGLKKEDDRAAIIAYLETLQ
ncbi:MAG: cytochrome c family protein [Pseudomonadota bacterium]